MTTTARKFEPIAPVSFAPFLAKIQIAASEDDYSAGALRGILDVVDSDIKVGFDTENFEWSTDSDLVGLMGPTLLGNGLGFWGMCAGGDWEHPVFFIIYSDGKKLRGYVPTLGNPWNTTTKQAYGNDEEADLKNAKKRWPAKFKDATEVVPEDFEFDRGEILKDITTRLVPNSTER